MLDHGCEHNSIFIDTSTFLKILLEQSEDPPATDRSFNKLKRSCILYTSHLVIGEIYNAIHQEYINSLKENLKNAEYQFQNLCKYSRELLLGISLLEIDPEVIQSLKFLPVCREFENRDNLILGTAIAHKCKSLFTSDKVFYDRIKEKLENKTINIKLF